MMRLKKGTVNAKIPQAEKTWTGTDLNEHVGEGNGDPFELVRKYGVGVRNQAGNRIVDFVPTHLTNVNIFFKEKLTRRVT